MYVKIILKVKYSFFSTSPNSPNNSNSLTDLAELVALRALAILLYWLTPVEIFAIRQNGKS